VSPEGHKSKASKGFIYSLGGFFVWGGDPMATGDVKRKLTAIFSADVEGYSSLMEEDELATVETLTSHKEIMRKLIQQYRGRVVDSTGDNLLAEFASVVDAVQCAVEVQQVLSAKNETLPEKRRMNFRIGINSGDVIEEGELIYGDGINVAARVESLAEGGGISISGTAFDQLGKKLPLGYEFLGEQTVKNIRKPVRVYRVLTEAEAVGKVIGEITPKTKQLRWAAIGGIVVLILVVGALAIWNFYLRSPFEPASEERMAFPLPDKPSIAVLPLVNMSGDPEQEYFSDGLTEEIITALSKSANMFVIARNSTFTYKGKAVKVRQVAEEMGVRYVLEGGVRKSGDRVRITAQLIDALRGNHLWAERYDREFKEIFALQDEITMKITTALQVKLTEGEQARMWEKGTDNLDAYLKCLQAREHFLRFNKDDNVLARKRAEEAISLDPDYAEPYARLAWTHALDARIGWSDSLKQSLARAEELAKKALELDNTLSNGRRVQGFIYLMKRQYDEAIAEQERTITLNPNWADAHAILGMALVFACRPVEAIEVLKKAIRLNPLPPSYYFVKLGRAYRMTEQYEQAIESYKKALNRSPVDVFAHVELAATYALLGREEKAREKAADVLKLHPKFSIERYTKGVPFKEQSETERLAKALRKAGLPETPPLPLPDKPSLAVLPFVNMSGDPEQEYFSDGITEEIITALSKTPKLFVIARNSTFTYKGKPVKVQQVGRDLGVKYVLEGSVRKAENKMRITAQLVDAQTGRQLWAERYDRELKDIFAIYDEITMKILTELQVKLTDGEQARLRAKGTEDLQVYLKCLQAREYLMHFTPEDNTRAQKMVKEVIAMDPKYPRPYEILAYTHVMDAIYGTSESRRESLRNAVKLAQKTIAMDQNNPDAHRLLGFIYMNTGQHDKALSEGEKVLKLDPNSADGYVSLGQFLSAAGEPEKAILSIKRGLRLNPIPPSRYFHMLASAYRTAGRYEEAIVAGKKAIEIEPKDQYAWLHLAASYSLLGRLEEASAAVKEILRINPKFCIIKKSFYKNQEDMDRFNNALREAGLPDCPPRQSSK
jgi:adenylate cyclase